MLQKLLNSLCVNTAQMEKGENVGKGKSNAKIRNKETLDLVIVFFQCFSCICSNLAVHRHGALW